MGFLLISLVLNAAIIRLVGGLTHSLHVSNLGVAFIAAVLMMAADSLIFWIFPNIKLVGVWQLVAFVFVSRTVVLALVGLLLPGMDVRGVVGVLAGGVLLTGAYFAAQRILMDLAQAGLAF